ncbi:divalent-cation tolerance protein CutA [Haloplanus sp.]|uniref:divalent-cation tolerance protein CutA n=1 Tax=Haloplanus sp. TaxID=1961696 RepID=UPI0031B87C75
MTETMTTAYVTAPQAAADGLARRLVDERLAACVNVVPCDSVYRWGDEIHEDEESILLAKTAEDRYDDLRAAMIEWHPHDVPCIERFDAADAHDPFASWCVSAVQKAGKENGDGS